MFDKELVGRLYEKAGLLSPENIRLINHMLGVSHVAGFLARKLSQRGVAVDIQLAETAGALHDIGKAFNEDSSGHVIEGVNFLRQARIDTSIIRIVERHGFHAFPEGKITDPTTWEEKLVFLADLCFGEEIVPMRERREDIIVRYPEIRKEWLREKSEEIYKEIRNLLTSNISILEP